MKQRYSYVPIKLSLRDSRLTLQNVAEFAQWICASPQRFVQYTHISVQCTMLTSVAATANSEYVEC